MKRFLAIFLAFNLIFNFLSFSYADTIDTLKNTEIGTEIENIESLNKPSGDANLEVEEYQDDGTSIGKGGILDTILDWILGVFEILYTPLMALIIQFPTIDGCIFNTESFFKLSFFDANPSGTAAAIQSMLSAVYNAFRYLVTAAYIVILVYLAIRMMLSSIGRQKAHYKELFKHWLVGLLILFSFHWVMAFIIWISNVITDIFANLSVSLLGNASYVAPVKFDSGSHPITNFVFSRIHFAVAPVLGILDPLLRPLLLMIFFGSVLSIIITYFKRLFTISILILTFPLVALSYVFDKIGDRKAQTLAIWLKEFTVNVMLQPIHALILTFISVLFSTGISGKGLFAPNLIGAVMSLFALRLIPTGEELLKKLFQINSSMGPGSQGIAGSMARAGMALGGAQKVFGALGKAGKGVKEFINARGRHELKPFEGFKSSVKAFNNARRKNGNAHLIRNAKDTLAGLKASKFGTKWRDYKEDVLARTHSKNMASAYMKAWNPITAASFGIGTAITGASSGKFLSEAASRAAIGAEIADKANGIAYNLHNLFKGDDTKGTDYKYLADLVDRMSNDEYKEARKNREFARKFEVALGLGNGQLAYLDKDQVSKACRDVEVGEKFGVPKEDLKSFHYIARMQKEVNEQRDPSGNGEALDLGKSGQKFIGKDGTYAIFNGVPLKISELGDPTLADGETRSLDPTLKGKSAKDNMRAILRNNPAYVALRSKADSQSKFAEMCDEEEEEANKALNKAQTAKENAKTAKEDAKTAKEDAKTAKENAKTALDTASKNLDTYNEKLEVAGDYRSSTEKALTYADKELSDAEGNCIIAFDELNDAQANFSTLSLNPSTPPEKITEARKELDAAQKKYNTAEKNRQEANEKYDTAEKNHQEANAKYDTAVKNRQEANAGLEKANADLKEAEAKCQTTNTNYETASSVHNEKKKIANDAHKDLKRYERDVNKFEDSELKHQFTADKIMSTLNLSTPTFTETAFEAVVKDSSKGDYFIKDGKLNVSLNGENYTMDISDKVMSQIGNSNFSSSVTVNSSTLKKAKEYVISGIFEAHPDMQTQRESAKNALISAIESGDAERIESASVGFSNIESQVSTELSTMFELYASSPLSVPEDAPGDIKSTFTSAFIAGSTTKQNSYNIDTTLPDAFSYGVCDDLTAFLDSWKNKPVIIYLRKVSDTSLSIKASTSTETETIETSTDVINEIFGYSDTSIDLYNYKGIWCKK